MKRHSDPKALLRDRGNSSFKWGSRVGDRPPRHASKITSDPETPFGKESPSIKSASENEEEKTIRTLLEGDGGAGTDVLGGKFVPLGEHHDGSFGVYMAHKISKLRQQTNGAVGRLEGEEGKLFKGVVAHINGYTKLPVATIRELLASRGGVVEAYNTSKVTHMICESLPYAKIRELRKVSPYELIDDDGVRYSTMLAARLTCPRPATWEWSREEKSLLAPALVLQLRHPPTVICSAWISDSISAGRKLPTASYMVNGVSVQKSTLAASFDSSRTPKIRGSGGGHSVENTEGRARVDHNTQSGVGIPPSRPESGDSRKMSSMRGDAHRHLEIGTQGEVVGMIVEDTDRPHSSRADPSDMEGTATGATSVSRELASVERRLPNVLTSMDKTLRSNPSSRPTSKSGIAVATGKDIPTEVPATTVATAKETTRADCTKEASPLDQKSEDDSSPPLPWLETPGLAPPSERGRSTMNDPSFMKTFFKASRLHFIGVGRAHAVKVVNAGLAARARPGGVQPKYGGTLGRADSRVILHVDMDCFFVSVLLRNRPELRDKPVAVAHNASNANGAGSSEVSSCNYPARAKGVKAGMFMMRAKELCPALIVLRYNFEAYRDASDKMFGVFLRYAPVLMAVSCDEAFLELAQGTDAMEAATEIRREIMKETGCPASAGASSNMLLARIATKQAKPNGQVWLPPEIAMHHVGPLPVQDLPGVGWKLKMKLNEHGLKKCSDLWSLSLAHLQKGLGFGEKTGQLLWQACRGIDKRPVQAPPDRKSIGAEVSYGIRFKMQAQAEDFMGNLAVELSNRMHAEGVVGRALTIKLMKQRDGVGPPRKYLGHGICDVRSKLVNLRCPTADPQILKATALQLLREAGIPADKIRGLGLQMSRLDPAAEAGDATSPSFDGVPGSSAGALHDWLRRAELDKAKESRAEEKQELPVPELATPAPRSDAVVDSRLEGKCVAESSSRKDGSDHRRNREMTAGTNGRSKLDTPDLQQHVPGGHRSPTPAAIPESASKRDDSKKRVREEDIGKTPESSGPPGSRHRVDPLPRTPISDHPSRARPLISPVGERNLGVKHVTRERSPLVSSEESTRRETGQESKGLASLASEAAGTQGDRNLPVEQGRDAYMGRSSDMSTARVHARSPPLAPRRLPTHVSPGSPFPTSPAGLSTDSPVSSAKGSPSMSQVDSSVLSALPPDLRQEVLLQLEARQQRRDAECASHEADVSSSPRRPSYGVEDVIMISSAANTVRWYGSIAGGQAGGSASGTGSAGAPPERASGGGIREGFDVTVSEASAKAQQVSLDSLWTLRKLRDSQGSGGDGQPSVFDRDSLRAMPLGLGLQYASMTEAQRAQIARQYAQAASDKGDASDSRSRESRLLKDHADENIRLVLEADKLEAEDSTDVCFRETAESIDLTSPLSHRRASPNSRGFKTPISGSSVSARSLRSPELQHMSLSQVDRDVLDCLPPDVREEVLRAIGADGGVNTEDDGIREPVASNRAFEEVSGAANPHEGGENIPDDFIAESQSKEPSLLEKSRELAVVDVRSPSSQTPPSHSENLMGERKDAREDLCKTGRSRSSRVFAIEEAGVLRRALRSWIGAVSSPSQWHLELLYRYLEELVEDGRLNETAILLRCLGRLSRNANRAWSRAYEALLGAIQDLIRQRNRGMSLSLSC